MSSARPDLAALELLVGVAQQGSLSAAARSLDMAQPNASRALARLERHLGVRLVVRGPTGSRLTPEGNVVVEWARDALQAVERVVIGGQALAGRKRSQLAVCASMTVAEYLVPTWLGDFRREHAGIHVNLEVCNSEEVVAAVAAGRADVGFVESPALPRSLHSTTVGRDRLVVVVHPAHPWARRRHPVTLEELAAAPLIVREPGSGTRETLERALRSAGLPLAPPELELSSNAAVAISARSGLAAAVLSELAVSDAVRSGWLSPVPVAGASLARRLRAVWRPPARLTGVAASLVAIARRPTP